MNMTGASKKTAKMDKINIYSNKTTLQGKFDLHLSFSYLALFLLLYIALPSFILSVFLLLRIGTPESAYWISVALLSGIIFYSRDKLNIGDYVAFFCIIVSCHLLVYFIFDMSADALAYHQPAIKRIANGFNPVYDGYMNLDRQPDVWSDQATYFPKAIWYFASTVMAALGDIQLGKVYNLCLLISALFFVWDATKNEHISVRALWAIACLNPVALFQIPHYLVDGALSSLSTISLFYAYLFFSDKPISRLQHIFCIVALSMLFCVKTSGFGYGGVVMFFIVMNDLVKKYREKETFSGVTGFCGALKDAFKLSLKLGLPVLLIVLVWGFAPYATNMLNGRNIFYPLVHDGSERSGAVQVFSEDAAKVIYPNANNRFTRLLYSIASRTVIEEEPVSIKNPFDVSVSDFETFARANQVYAAGLGPLFFLFLLLSVTIPLVFIVMPPARSGERQSALFAGDKRSDSIFLRANGWLLLTIMALLFVQPYSWLMRFAPFLWITPIVCLMSIPQKWSVLLWLPLSVAFLNASGAAYPTIVVWQNSNIIREDFSVHSEETVMLTKSIYEYDGIFDRYGIRQKFINPEETIFHRQNTELALLAENSTPYGVNFFYKENLMPLPETLLDFSREAAMPWIMMSEGLMPIEIETTRGFGYVKETAWITYDNKLKFYMSLDKEPKEDWELTLKGSLIGTNLSTRQRLEAIVFINNREIGKWSIDQDTRSATFAIPQALMAESFMDETRLVTLMLLLRDVPSFREREGKTLNYGVHIEGMQIRP